MADTPGSSSAEGEAQTSNSLRANIQTVFAEWQWLANELSSVSDSDLRNPVFSLSKDEQSYLHYLCSVVNNSLESLHNIQTRMDADLSNERTVLTDLQNQLQTQTQLNVVLQNQLSQLMQNAPAQAFNSPAGARRQTSRNPEPFKGEKTGAVARQNEYLAWKQGLQICWVVDATVFDTEKKKLLHMASLIGGHAHQERLKDIDDILQDNSAHTTAALFLKKLDSLYITIDSEREAAIQFDKLKMPEKQAFSTFYIQLEHLGNQCHKSDREMVLALKQKVSEELKLMVRMDSSPCALDDVEGWRKKFTIWSQNCRENDHYNIGPSKNNHNQPRFNTPTPTPATTLHSDPMELDAVKFQNRVQQREEERRLGLCHYCKKPGHSVWDCEAKKQADAQRVARGYNTGPPRGVSGYSRGNAGRGNQQFGRGGQYRSNNNYNQNDFREYGHQHQPYARQQLNTFHGYVENSSLAPSESASNVSPRSNTTSPPPSNSTYEFPGNVSPPQ